MLKVLKVATFLSVACVTAASAAPGMSSLGQARHVPGASVELVRGGECWSRSCKAGRRSASRRASHERRHRGSRHRARSSRSYGGATASRGCLTSPARALLSRIEGRFGPVSVISTCRPGARIAGSGRISRHASGNAVDFDAGRRKSQIVSWLIANHKSGGTMTYPAMNHIHVDIGPHFVSIAGGKHYASWSSGRKKSRHVRQAEQRRSYRKHAIKRGPSLARAYTDSDNDD